MLKQGFIDPPVMILKLDGPSNEIWTFTNEKILKEISIDRYIKDLAYKSESIKLIDLEDGNTLEIVNGLHTDYYLGLSVKLNNVILVSGIFYSKDGNQYEIKNGKILKILYRCSYLINNYQVSFFCKHNGSLSKGDMVIDMSHLKEKVWYMVHESNCFIKITDGVVWDLKEFSSKFICQHLKTRFRNQKKQPIPLIFATSL